MSTPSNERNIVLIVDDSDFDRYILCRQINVLTDDVEINEFCCGSDAIDFISSESFSKEIKKSRSILILVDINMPIMDGFEFIEALERLSIISDYKGIINIYVISSTVDKGDLSLIKANDKLDGFISKPPSIEDVRNALR